jgi:hypothetical protein
MVLVKNDFDSVSILFIGRDIFGCDRTEIVRIVLESDGTHVDDGECLNWLPDNTTFILLRSSDTWISSQKDADAAHKQTASDESKFPIFPIPRAVCETLNLLEIRHEPPFWKIIDNRGRITLVLHWEEVRKNRIRPICTESSPIQLPNPVVDGGITITSESTSISGIKIQSVPAKRGENVAARSENQNSLPSISDDWNVSNTKEIEQHPLLTSLTGKKSGKLLKEFDENESSSVPCHIEPKFSFPKPRYNLVHATARNVNSHNKVLHTDHNPDKCEFHCGSLHEKGHSIDEDDDTQRNRRRKEFSYSTPGKNTHVRFHDQERNLNEMHSLLATRLIDNPSSSQISIKKSQSVERKSPELKIEQETNNILSEEDFENECSSTTDKLLLLTDQLTMDRNRKHLTILDLGVILDRLKGKILDVERLEREIEGPSCYRWIIKATIRGQMLRELGVLYNGNYYSISEDPGFVYAASGFEDDEDRGDPV